MHDRATRGQTLIADEQARLTAWYTAQAATKAITPGETTMPADLRDLEAGVEQAIARILAASQQIQELTAQNARLCTKTADLQRRRRYPAHMRGMTITADLRLALRALRPQLGRVVLYECRADTAAHRRQRHAECSVTQVFLLYRSHRGIIADTRAQRYAGGIEHPRIEQAADQHARCERHGHAEVDRLGVSFRITRCSTVATARQNL